MSFETAQQPSTSHDPTASFLSTSAFDFLLIELVPLAHRVSLEKDVVTSNTSTLAETTGNAAYSIASATTGGKAAASAAATTSVSGSGARGGGTTTIEEEEMDAIKYRLEMQGYRVGQGLVERFSRDRPRFNDTLDVIKFLCKDLWSLVFGKNIDNLKTNHRGVYVLTDNVFRPLSRMSTEAGGQAVARAQPFLWFPCGIVRGALAALGINTTVQAEITALPGAVFQIKTLPSKT